MPKQRIRVAVLGGGIQGVCIALELAQRGAQVTIFEKRQALMSGASLTNEGKIHLGFVYAKDGSLRTARLMARGALSFAPTLERWLESASDLHPLSQPFHYAVHRKSLLSPDQLANRYARIGAELQQLSALPKHDYFQRREVGHVRRLERRSAQRLFDDRTVVAAFETQELAVDPIRIAERLRERVAADPNIEIACSTEVDAVNRERRAVHFTRDHLDQVEEFDQIVNCAWCGRLRIDRSAGIEAPAPGSFRVKHFLRIAGSATTARNLHIPSVTIVLGGFGDVVHYGNGDIYLCWYPRACRGMTTGLAPRDSDTVLTELQATRMSMDMASALKEAVPSIGDLSERQLATGQVRNGVIYALGTTDVDDPSSPLHQRFGVGPRSYGSYHTVDTGKYTLAPLFAMELADAIQGLSKAAA